MKSFRVTETARRPTVYQGQSFCIDDAGRLHIEGSEGAVAVFNVFQWVRVELVANPSTKTGKSGRSRRAAVKSMGKTTKEKPKSGKRKGTGINKPVEKAKVPQEVAKNTYGKPTPKQKM